MKVKKVLALLLALTLMVGLLPGQALAAEEDGFTVVSTWDELCEAVIAGSEKIRFGGDIVSTENDCIVPSKFCNNVVLDLDGYTFSGQGEWEGGLIHVGEDANVTIRNGTISVGDGFSCAVFMYGGTLTLSNLNLNSGIECRGGVLTSVKDCEITCTPSGEDVGFSGIRIVGLEYGDEVSEIGSIENCTITAALPIFVGEGVHVGTISDCTLNAVTHCIETQGTIDTIQGNRMTSTHEYGRGVAVDPGGTIGTISGNTIKAFQSGIELFSGTGAETIVGNTISDCRMGIAIRENVKVGTIKDCGITCDPEKEGAAGIRSVKVESLGAMTEIGSIENCTISAPTAIEIAYGSVDEISGCTLTNCQKGIEIRPDVTVGKIKDCEITCALPEQDEGFISYGIFSSTDGESTAEIGSIENCTITAVVAVNVAEGIHVGTISDCTLTTVNGCIGSGGSIDTIRGNRMTVSAGGFRGIGTTGTIGTVSGNTFTGGSVGIDIFLDAKVENITGNTASVCLAFISEDAEAGTISGNTVTVGPEEYALDNYGTIRVLGKNNFTGIIRNEGTILSDQSNPVPVVPPTPSNPRPSNPQPSNPQPTEPEPTESQPAEPEPTESQPAEPEPTESQPAEPEPTESQPAEPEPTESQPTEPEPTESQPAEPEPSAPVYQDVRPDAWYGEAASYVSSRGLMTGTAEGTFSPKSNMTRAMLWTVLGRLDGADVDNSEGKWYEKSQAWIVEKGISDGTNANKDITREEMVVMLWRYLGSPAAETNLEQFSDCETVSGWASSAMQWAVSTGILKGSDGALKPRDAASRAEVATILMRFCEQIESEPSDQ